MKEPGRWNNWFKAASEEAWFIWSEEILKVMWNEHKVDLSQREKLTLYQTEFIYMSRGKNYFAYFAVT
jgi:hypothetical protein